MHVGYLVSLDAEFLLLVTKNNFQAFFGFGEPFFCIKKALLKDWFCEPLWLACLFRSCVVYRKGTYIFKWKRGSLCSFRSSSTLKIPNNSYNIKTKFVFPQKLFTLLHWELVDRQKLIAIFQERDKKPWHVTMQCNAMEWPYAWSNGTFFFARLKTWLSYMTIVIGNIHHICTYYKHQ